MRARASRRTLFQITIGRKVETYKTGQLFMLWQQRHCQGQLDRPCPLLMEGSTAWLCSGATLIRAKVNQIRLFLPGSNWTPLLRGQRSIARPSRSSPLGAPLKVGTTSMWPVMLLPRIDNGPICPNYGHGRAGWWAGQ